MTDAYTYDDPALEAKWLAEQREYAIAYLVAQHVEHGGLDTRSAWSLAPYIALWSADEPGGNAIGVWVIVGDVPTDFMWAEPNLGPRDVMRAFAARWLEVSDFMLRGQEHPTIRIGSLGQQSTLGDLLRRRALVLQDFADDESMWVRS